MSTVQVSSLEEIRKKQKVLEKFCNLLASLANSPVCVCAFSLSAAQFVKQKLPDLLRSYVDADLGGNQEGGFQDIAIEVLHLLLSHLLFGQKGASGVGQEQIDAFLKTLCRGIGGEHIDLLVVGFCLFVVCFNYEPTVIF